MAPQAGATALRPLAASSVHSSRLVGARRGRPTAHEGVATATTFLPSFPVRRGVSRRPPARPTTTRAALFSLPLSLSLSVSFSPTRRPIPAIPAPPFNVRFSFFSLPRPSLIFPRLRTTGFCELPAFAGVGRPRRARDVRVPRSRRSVTPCAELCYRATTTRPASDARLEYGIGLTTRQRRVASHRYGDAGGRKEGRAAMQRGAGTYVLAACCRRPGARGC